MTRLHTSFLTSSVLLVALVFLVAPGGTRLVLAQEGSTIPDNIRGNEQSVARGILDGNLIETNYRNHGELSRWNDIPFGYWPRGVGNPRHIDGVAVIVAGLVRGERPAQYYTTNPRDTLLNLVSSNYRGAGSGTTVGPRGDVWGWLPLPGFHNTLRRHPVTGQREPVPATSADPNSWPQYWPDKLHEEDSGWPGSWNGTFGKGVFNADQESFYVMDDLGDRSYQFDPVTGQPNSQFGLFFPDPSDPTKGGLGLQMNVRILQWANILAEDTMFLIYRVTNKGQTNFGECIDLGGRAAPPNSLEATAAISFDGCGNMIKTGLYFVQFVDYGLGNEEGDETAAFDPILDIAYGWDHDGLGTDAGTGQQYTLGYTGFAFLESPTNDTDGLDNDQDGITDEERFGGPGMRIEGQDAIRAEVERRYDMNLFEAKYGPLEERPAFREGIWWTGDENLDWRGFSDLNGNGRYDDGELINDDFGRDGLGPFDLGYPGPDLGEADGIPTIREPNFDELDVDESDLIGLTGFHLGTRPSYESGDNLRNDTFMWLRIRESQFGLTEPARQEEAGNEPFLNFSSGPVNLGANETDFFSTAWIFGANEQDFFKNRQTVQNIYNADYRFAQPPIVPTLKAEAGDGYVVLSWDTLSVASFDRFTQRFDFEGYKLYRGTDELLSDARVITDVNGVPTFYRPIARWDLENGQTGRVPVLDNTAFFDLGSDTGLEFSYIDRNVTNGKTYYYALVAYDHGFVPDADDPNPDASPVDPQENTFNVQTRTPNVAVVTPRTRAAGYIGAGANEDLSQPTEGIGTGSIDINVVNTGELQANAVYRLSFFDSTDTGSDVYRTVGYELRNVTTNQLLIPRTPYSETTPAVDGFVISIHNDEPVLNEATTGWQGLNEDGEVVYSRNPGALANYETNWGFFIQPDSSSRYAESPFEYELRWQDTPYVTPSRNFGGYLPEVELPFACTNLTTGEPCEIFVYDQNGNGQLDLTGDSFIISDARGFIQRFRYQINFGFFGVESIPPSPGDVIHIGTMRPFSRNDYFQFTMNTGHVDTELAKSELDLISVVPNPYVAAASWEERPEVSGRGPRKIQFTHLPEQCTIKIFTMRGELVRTLEHNGIAGDGAAFWDLKTEDNQDVAYGIYFYHVEAPGIGEKVGKFALIK